MPTKSYYSPTGTIKNTDKSLVIDQFYGVDYSTAQLEIADNHAIESENIIFRDRVNQKRQGWEQLLQTTEYKYRCDGDAGNIYRYNTKNINGVWDITDENGNNHLIAHIGKLLFEIYGMHNKSSFLNNSLIPIYETYDGNVYYCTELNDTKSTAFYDNHRLYILDGVKYRVIKWDTLNNRYMVYDVEEDEDTYIPTTTIGITYTDSPTNSRTALDDVNLMTQWRKNKLVSGTYKDDGISVRTTAFYEYELDSNIVTKYDNDIYDMEVVVNTIKYNGGE